MGKIVTVNGIRDINKIDNKIVKGIRDVQIERKFIIRSYLISENVLDLKSEGEGNLWDLPVTKK